MREIGLTKGYAALVDDEDYERLASFKWFANECRHSVYAVRQTRPVLGGPQVPRRMHHDVLGLPSSVEVDHVDGNGCNNKKDNLRLSLKKNRQNARKHIKGSSRLKGVACRENGKSWRSYIRVNGDLIRLGTFSLEDDAGRAYDEAARKHFGEFACVNFPRAGERSAI